MRIPIPDTVSLVMFIMLLFIGLTWIVPAGTFDREEVNNRERVVPGTFHSVEQSPQQITALVTAPLKGFVQAAPIIGFVLLVGGAFGILHKAGSIQHGLAGLIQTAKNKPGLRFWIIPVVMVLFSICGATFGMAEEVLVFILITLPLSQALGFDRMVGIAIPFVGAGVGFAGAFINPFTVGIAQEIAEVPLFTGTQYRLVVWATLTFLAIFYVMWYARRLNKKQVVSTVPFTDADTKSNVDIQALANGNPAIVHRINLIILALSIVLLIYGVNEWGWYITEISGLFLAMGILVAIASRMAPGKASEAFIDGAKDMVMAALVIGLARGLLVIATDGQIMDTILFALSSMASHLPGFLSAQMMFVVQSMLNFFIPSGSGQAALTMPLMAPLSDLLGMSRQTAVLAFQLGDGISNLIIPTSGVTMGVLAIAKVNYAVWLKWALPLFIILTLAAMILLIPPSLGWVYPVM